MTHSYIAQKIEEGKNVGIQTHELYSKYKT